MGEAPAGVSVAVAVAGALPAISISYSGPWTRQEQRLPGGRLLPIERLGFLGKRGQRGPQVSCKLKTGPNKKKER